MFSKKQCRRSRIIYNRSSVVPLKSIQIDKDKLLFSSLSTQSTFLSSSFNILGLDFILSTLKKNTKQTCDYFYSFLYISSRKWLTLEVPSFRLDIRESPTLLFLTVISQIIKYSRMVSIMYRIRSLHFILVFTLTHSKACTILSVLRGTSLRGNRAGLGRGRKSNKATSVIPIQMRSCWHSQQALQVQRQFLVHEHIT